MLHGISHDLKYLCATYIFINVDKKPSVIADALGITTLQVYQMADSPYWSRALYFWGHPHLGAKPKKYAQYRQRVANHREYNRKQRQSKKRRKQRIKAELYNKQSGKCNGCQREFALYHLTRDHIFPKSKGGSSDKENLQLLCRPCNRLKADGTQEALLSKLRIQKRENTVNRFNRLSARAVSLCLSALTSVALLRIF